MNAAGTPKPPSLPSTFIVLPTLAIRGGQFEALRLGRDLTAAGSAVTLLVLWKHRHEIDAGGLPVAYVSDLRPVKARALFQLPELLMSARRWLGAAAGREAPHVPTVIATHYSTLPVLWLAHGCRRAAFIQDLEWRFVASPMVSRILKRFILAAYRKAELLLAANAYLQQSLIDLRIAIPRLAPIWADPFFRTPVSADSRTIDIAMMLRHGKYKRADLYFDLLARARAVGLRTAVITPDDDLAAQAGKLADQVLLRPSRTELRALYADSKVFAHMSDHEGFGLPPLEAMAAGCVPVCRDSGGVRCYMLDPRMCGNLLPASWSIGDLFDHIASLARDPDALARQSQDACHIFADGAAATIAQRQEFLNTYHD